MSQELSSNQYLSYEQKQRVYVCPNPTDFRQAFVKQWNLIQVDFMDKTSL